MVWSAIKFIVGACILIYLAQIFIKVLGKAFTIVGCLYTVGYIALAAIYLKASDRKIDNLRRKKGHVERMGVTVFSPKIVFNDFIDNFRKVVKHVNVNSENVEEEDINDNSVATPSNAEMNIDIDSLINEDDFESINEAVQNEVNVIVEEANTVAKITDTPETTETTTYDIVDAYENCDEFTDSYNDIIMNSQNS